MEQRTSKDLPKSGPTRTDCHKLDRHPPEVKTRAKGANGSKVMMRLQFVEVLDKKWVSTASKTRSNGEAPTPVENTSSEPLDVNAK